MYVYIICPKAPEDALPTATPGCRADSPRLSLRSLPGFTGFLLRNVIKVTLIGSVRIPLRV